MTPDQPPSLKQPVGIYYLFLTEMWERFSYYGLTALLILYIAQSFAIPDREVYAIYGAYGALVYTTPILGGFIADKLLGVFRTVIAGAILIAAGHFVMAVHELGHQYFYLGLALIITGTGLFLPNIATVVGRLYERDDPRRDGGFTLAYMGRNLGTIIAPLICSWVALKYGYLMAFSLAGFGMLFGLVVFWRGRSHYHPEIFKPARIGAWLHQAWYGSYFIFMLLLLISVPLVYVAMNHVDVTGDILYITGILTFVLLFALALRGTQNERNSMFLVILLILFFVIFMALLQQSGGMLNLFTLRHVNRHWLYWTIPTGWYQAVEPLFILALGPLYTKMWNRLFLQGIEVSYPLKFAIGLVIMGFAFAVLVLGMNFLDAKDLMPMTWINVSYFFQAAGELFIGPIGLGMISRLVPQRYMGLFMGAWVLAMAFANFVAAKIGALTSAPSMQLHLLPVSASLALYNRAFQDLMWLAFATAALLILIVLLFKKMKNLWKIYS